MKGRFINKALLIPITASEVMERHQVDLVSMRDQPIEFQGTVYRYILTLQDVFSRFLWMRPMSRKKSSIVAQELMYIYREHGPPRILQCDNGGEFRGDTTKICKKIGVKVINSRAYHPQSQGKVERSHRTLRDKIRYDMLKEGTNWVKNLPKYQSIMNDDVKLELGGKSPFEIYYKRKSNYVVKPNADSDPESEGDDSLVCPKVWPTISKNEIQQIELRSKLIAKVAYDASKKYATTMVNRSLRQYPLPIYKLNEKVIIRYPFGFGKKTLKRRFSIFGRVVGRNIPLSQYTVSYRNPESKQIERSTILVSDITSKTLLKERKRKKYTCVTKLLDRAHQEERLKGFLKNLSSEVRTENVFKRDGFVVRFNPLPDGNCQFSAIADQLRRNNVADLTPSEVREQTVAYMVEHCKSPFNDREDFSILFNSDRYQDYNEYIERMQETSTYGDHLTLQAISELFFVRIHVVSAEGALYDRFIEPQEATNGIETLAVGYFHEGNGEHYLSIDGEGIDFNIYDENHENIYDGYAELDKNDISETAEDNNGAPARC